MFELLVFLTAVSVALTAAPTNCRILNQSGEIVSTLSLYQYDLVGPLSLRCDQTDVSWSVSPSFPYSIRLDTKEGLINGQVTELMESTLYNLTAVNSDGESSTTLSISVAQCPHGNPLYVELFYADLAVVRLYDGDKEVFYYEKTRRIEPYACLPYQSYRYSAMCRTGKDGFCYFQFTDYGNVTFTEFKTPELQQVNGSFDMVPKSKPSLFVEKDPIVFVTGSTSLIYIGASTVHTRFAFSPALPSTITFNPLLSSLTGKWMERGVFSFNVTCFNSVGEGSLVITVNVDMCGEPLQDLSFSRIYTTYGETMNLTDASGTNLLSIPFSGGTHRDIVCVPEGVYFLHLEGVEKDGWSKDPLTVRNYHIQRMGDYSVPAGQHSLDTKLVVKKLLSASDTWSFHLGDVSEDWTSGKYREKGWKNGRSGEWGRFDSSKTTLFRRQVDMDSDYGTMMLEVEADGAVELFVNGVLVWSQTVAVGLPQKLTFRASQFGTKAVLAVRLRQNASFDDEIRFSVVMRPIMASTLLRSENGVATGSFQGKSDDPEVVNAFDLNKETFWLVDALPATATYMFGNASVAVNSIYLFVNDWFKNGIREITVEGITADTQTVNLTTVKTPSFLKGDAYRELRLNNEFAFAGYRLHFIGSRTGFIRMYDICMRVADHLLCKKKIGLSALETGSSHYKMCPLGKVGARVMRCENVENVATWVDDRSACVSRFPSSDVAFVDSWFHFTNVTMWNWEKYNDLLLNVITEQLIVKRREISTVVVRDESTENDTVITAMMRFEVEEAIGDYVLSHLKQLLPDLPKLYKDILPTSLSDGSVEYVKEPVLYEPIHWSGIARSCLNGGMIIAVTALITFCFLQKRRRTKSLSRKGTKRDGQLLLQE